MQKVSSSLFCCDTVSVCVLYLPYILVDIRKSAAEFVKTVSQKYGSQKLSVWLCFIVDRHFIIWSFLGAVVKKTSNLLIAETNYVNNISIL